MCFIQCKFDHDLMKHVHQKCKTVADSHKASWRKHYCTEHCNESYENYKSHKKQRKQAKMLEYLRYNQRPCIAKLQQKQNISLQVKEADGSVNQVLVLKMLSVQVCPGLQG